MSGVFHRSFFLEGPAGRLEALLWTVSAPQPRMTALVCHPHPLFGGTMHNKVVYAVAKTLNRLGLPVLRFNFRGAGRSDGAHDDGRGEQGDARAALDWLAAEFPGCPLLLAGFSFGSVVGLRVGCADPRVTRLVGLGLPVNRSDLSFLRQCAKPKLFLHGVNDEHGARDRLESLLASVPGPKQTVLVEGADHFFTGKLSAVEDALRNWVATE